MSASDIAKRLAAALEPALVAALKDAAVLAGPYAPAVDVAIDNVDARVRANNPGYFPGIATVGSATPAQNSRPSDPLPTVDTSTSPLATQLAVPTVDSKPEDVYAFLGSLVAYVHALDAKLDALVQASGLGGSAAMADHH